MSVYQRKLIELLAIIEKDEGSFLHIRFTIEQDSIEAYWKVDDFTVSSIKDMTNFSGLAKYRISFHPNTNVSDQQVHTSILTRTQRNQSERTPFSCSEDYIEQLQEMKSIQAITDLDKLNFLSMNLPTSHDQEDEAVPEEKKRPKKMNNQMTWMAIAAVCLISAILFGYSSHAYLDKTVIEEATPIKHTTLVKEINEPEEKSHFVKESVMIEDRSSDNQTNLPYVELEDEITYKLPEGTVALTFDDGPSKYSIEILTILKEYNVGGTFFFIGHNVEKHPDYVQQIYSDGYSIGTHSMNHVNVATLSYEKQENELIESSQRIESIIGEAITLFRPPYGATNVHTENLIHDHHHKMVLWNNDPKDWESQQPDKIVESIRSTDVSGDIILLHESPAVIQALPKIIEYLQELDLEIVNLL
ncbi:polysaccharide deacetylase family protein [Ornithinibacillus sp. L9]|uniref:Polysaccharide deacetylase family protein n=1 Tax=Ornithinibacillus caprae TaxID=2678566 RepID=A0A6N8FK73_9BACI|nr:polysaccharide deacetylase family protein [Ornithinibacillus caprae]MUK88179.1 polysaccharide deacetylase family protein [Ornithinibacillus caprae]